MWNIHTPWRSDVSTVHFLFTQSTFTICFSDSPCHSVFLSRCLKAIEIGLLCILLFQNMDDVFYLFTLYTGACSGVHSTLATSGFWEENNFRWRTSSSLIIFVFILTLLTCEKGEKETDLIPPIPGWQTLKKDLLLRAEWFIVWFLNFACLLFLAIEALSWTKKRI